MITRAMIQWGQNDGMGTRDRMGNEVINKER